MVSFCSCVHHEVYDNVLDVLKAYSGNIDPVSEQQQRDIGVGAQILRDLGVRRMKLMTNHPVQRIGLIGFGLEIVEKFKNLKRRTECLFILIKSSVAD
jgi:GTP cyclohydrolase II